jgi:hypothetical protein
MRGAARVGGKGFKVPKTLKDLGEALRNEEDYPVPTSLVPINDQWSWSLGAEPADPRDCSRYPSSPYCGEVPFRWGPPLGYQIDYKNNGCETCAYIYPVILWLLATPQIICYRNPNCDQKKKKNTPPQDSPEIPEIPEGYKLQILCIRTWEQEGLQLPNKIAGALDGRRFFGDQTEEKYTLFSRESWIYSVGFGINDVVWHRVTPKAGDDGIVRVEESSSFNVFRSQEKDGKRFLNALFRRTTGGDNYAWNFPSWLNPLPYLHPTDAFGSPMRFISVGFWADFYWDIKFALIPVQGGNPFEVPPISVKPPPPYPDGNDNDDNDNDDNRKRKRKRKKMCCNDCRDSKDNTDKLLREIKEIKKALGTGKLEKVLDAAVGIGDSSVTAIPNLIAKRLGTSAYPMEVPESLLQGVGDGIKKIDSNAEFLHWLTYQFDSLVGQFPVDIDVIDIDPLKAGDQQKKIQIPNIAEAIAEIYGLTIKSSVNQEVELNMLLRLAAETIATKNAAVVTQDYARANAIFLGYKANPKSRELQYNFDFTGASLDPRSKEPIVLENLLKTVKGYVQGWEIADKETVVGFLQKIMFSAGIIKSVFFRGKKQQKELQREMTSMVNDEKTQEAKFEAFIKEINDPESRFNRDSIDKPTVKDVTPPDSKETKK